MNDTWDALLARMVATICWLAAGAAGMLHYFLREAAHMEDELSLALLTVAAMIGIVAELVHWKKARATPPTAA